MSEIRFMSTYGPMSERSGFAHLNESFAESVRTRICDRMDGTVGVAMYGAAVMRVLSPDDARHLADALVDAAEAAESDDWN